MEREEQTQAPEAGYTGQEPSFWFYGSTTPASAEPQPPRGALKQRFSIRRNSTGDAQLDTRAREVFSSKFNAVLRQHQLASARIKGAQSLQTFFSICGNRNKLQPGYSYTSSLKTACLCKGEPSGFTLRLALKHTYIYIRFLNFCQTTGNIMVSACC